MGISRRDFLTRVGQAGGYSAAFLTMQGLGLLEASAAPRRLHKRTSGIGQRDQGGGPWRRHCRVGSGLRTASARVRVYGSRGSRETRWTELDGARRRQGSFSGWNGSVMHMGSGPLPELRSGASAVDPSDDPGVLQKVGCGTAGGSEHEPFRLTCKMTMRTAASRQSCARWSMTLVDM